MPRNTAALQKELAYREAFLARLSNNLATPTSEWPTVRCWTEQSLNRIFRQIRNELAEQGMETNLTHRSLLEWIERLGLAHSVPIDGGSFHLVEIGASAGSEVDPLELLMAAKPSGVVCYFSAVAFHSLTTQPVRHHHVAELRPQSSSQRKEDERPSTPRVDEVAVAVSSTSRELGALLFRYQDIPFYGTRRSTRLVPGIQSRGYGPRTQIRITTREQTLLDSLSKPFHCGGPEVVFEAWQEGVRSGQVDEERLVEYLRKMSYPATARRVGAMLELVGHTPGNELKRVLDDYQKGMNRQSPFARISLLPGVAYQSVNEHWLVNTP